MTVAELAACQAALGYSFRDPGLLDRALTHASSKSETQPCNERLEFLGDSVVGMLVGEFLYRSYPEYDEGDLTKVKSVVVSAQTLADESRRLKLSRFYRVGKGMLHTPEEAFPRSLDANIFEAVVGAIYLDSGLGEARRFVLACLSRHVEAVVSDHHRKNWKSMLQHLSQRQFNATPTYRVTREEGPDHVKVFEVVAMIGERALCMGQGRSKKEAEQAAAAATLLELRGAIDTGPLTEGDG
ncbi:MAG: ribonuclease III [Planctomycetes bacterium]|nr:ribonuclease III [Planctomycetota bacterium]